MERDKEWCTIFLRGSHGGKRQELGKFPEPELYEHPMTRRHCSGGETPMGLAQLECKHIFEVDTDVVGGCSALLVLRLIPSINPRANPLTPAFAPSALPSTTTLAPDSKPRKVLSTIVPLAKTGSEPMQISHALLSESTLTWHQDCLTLIDPEENLGLYNDKLLDPNNLLNISPLPPDRAQIFGGKDIFGARGSISLRTRHSNVEQRIIEGILSRLESQSLAVRNAAVEAIHNFIGFGNLDAVQGVLRRLQHPELNVNALSWVSGCAVTVSARHCIHAGENGWQYMTDYLSAT